MKVCFRTDASYEIGGGHVMRSLTLAQELRARGASCFFISCKQNIGMSEVIRSQGFEVRQIPLSSEFAVAHDSSKKGSVHEYREGASRANWLVDAEESEKVLDGKRLDWMVVDHYGLDCQWERKLRNCCSKLMVIDDLADRVHDCDLLLDQNYCINQDARYLDLVPENCRLLLGPKFTLLRGEFRRFCSQSRDFSHGVRNILVFFGSSDPGNQTRLAVAALTKLDLTGISVNVVIGSAYSSKSELAEQVKPFPSIAVHEQVNNMAELMAEADLAIGAGGSTMWERCFMGLPALTVIMAQNQEKASHDVEKTGAIRVLGHHDHLGVMDYKRAIQELIAIPDVLRQMSINGTNLVEIGTGKVASAIEGM